MGNPNNISSQRSLIIYLVEHFSEKENIFQREKCRTLETILKPVFRELWLAQNYRRSKTFEFPETIRDDKSLVAKRVAAMASARRVFGAARATVERATINASSKRTL